MSVTSGFFNSRNGDRAYDAVQMSSIFDGLVGDGVILNYGDGLAVTAGSGMQVIVGSGRAWFNHTWTYNDSGLPLTLEDADLVGYRKDAIVLTVGTNTSVRRNSIEVITGTAVATQAGAVIPTLASNQHLLAYVEVDKNAENVIGKVHDQRGVHPSCPYATNLIEHTSVAELYSAWEAEFNQWFSHLHNELDENQAAHLQNQIDAIDEDISSVDERFDTVNTRLNGKANKPYWVSYTLWSSSWSSDSYSLEGSYPSSTYDIINVLPDYSSTSDAQRKAWAKADCGGYNNSNVIVAKGTVPTIDINIRLCIQSKAN